MKKCRLIPVLALVVLIAASCGKRAEQSSEPPAPSTPAPSSAPRVDVRLVKHWMTGLTNRRPGVGSTKANTLGFGALGVNVAGEATSWYEMVDVDSNGTKEKVGFMWDGTNKVMYAYTKDPVMLADGSIADQGLLVVQYGVANTKNREVGSGVWAYAVERDSTAAGKVTGTLFGCRFDKFGNETECGTGEWSRDGNEFTITTKRP